jgi:hypothetical protein
LLASCIGIFPFQKMPILLANKAAQRLLSRRQQKLTTYSNQNKLRVRVRGRDRVSVRVRVWVRVSVRVKIGFSFALFLDPFGLPMCVLPWLG